MPAAGIVMAVVLENVAVGARLVKSGLVLSFCKKLIWRKPLIFSGDAKSALSAKLLAFFASKLDNNIGCDSALEINPNL